MNYPFTTFIKKLFWPLQHHPKLWMSLIFQNLLWTSSGYVSILIMQYIVTVMEMKDISSFSSALIWLVLFYLVFEVIEYLSRNEWWVRFWFPFCAVIHKIIVPEYITLDNTATEKIGTGKTIAIMEKWIYAWTDACMNIIEYSIKILFAVGFGIYFISKVSLLYIPFYILLLCWVIVVVVWMNNKVLAHRNKRRDSQNDRTQQMVKVIMSKFEVLLSWKSSHEVSFLDKHMSAVQSHNLNMNQYLYRVFHIPSIFITLLRLFVYFTLWYGYFSWLYSLWQFTSFLGFIVILDKTVYEIVIFYKDFTKNISDITKLRELLETTPKMTWYTDGSDFVYQRGDISLKDISFSYSEGKSIFDNFSLDIQGGKKTALVWLSGSGKTTLMKMMAGYMRPDSGEMFVDGQPLFSSLSREVAKPEGSVSLQSYFSHIGYLTQEPSVFDGTIRENLMYGITEDLNQKILEDTKDKSSEQFLLSSALSLAHCYFVYDLPDGLDTQIGEKGVRLSGGQRQRLAIAKIFLKDPKIIFLDEPTSALDSLSEKLVTDAFHKLFEWRTVIIIAHRLQTVKAADEIIVLGNDGKKMGSDAKNKINNIDTIVIERWNHADLSVAGWVYQEMLELQSGFNF